MKQMIKPLQHRIQNFFTFSLISFGLQHAQCYIVLDKKLTKLCITPHSFFIRWDSSAELNF